MKTLFGPSKPDFEQAKITLRSPTPPSPPFMYPLARSLPPPSLPRRFYPSLSPDVSLSRALSLASCGFSPSQSKENLKLHAWQGRRNGGSPRVCRRRRPGQENAGRRRRGKSEQRGNPQELAGPELTTGADETRGVRRGGGGCGMER